MKQTEKTDIYLSIVIPLFNEEDNVDMLLEQLGNHIRPLDISYEILLVDDGSSDKTWNKISQAATTNPNIVGVRLARNFGHQHALLAGLNNVKGRARMKSANVKNFV